MDKKKMLKAVIKKITSVKVKKFLIKNIKSLENWKGKNYIKQYLSDIAKRKELGLNY